MAREYRFAFTPLTFSLLAFSISRTRFGPCVPPLRRQVILWATATVSVGPTVYSLVKQDCPSRRVGSAGSLWAGAGASNA